MKNTSSILRGDQSSVIVTFDELAVVYVIGQRVFVFAVQIEFYAVILPGVSGIILQVGVQDFVSDVKVSVVPEGGEGGGVVVGSGDDSRD